MIEAMAGIGLMADPLPNVWLADITLPSAINSNLGSTIFNEKVYFEGGSFFKVYDIILGTLTDKTPKTNNNLLNEKGSLLLINGCIYAFSGANANTFYEPDFIIPVNKLDIYNNATSWSSIGSISGISSPGDRFQGGKGVNYANVIYVIGGQYKASSLNSFIYQIGINGGAMTKTAIGRTFLNGTFNIVGANAYYIGGLGTKAVVRVSLPGKGITDMSPAPRVSNGHCAAVYNNKIYVYGGGFGSELWEYDPANDGWNLYARGGPGGSNGYMQVYKGKAYIFLLNRLCVAVLDPAQLPI